MGLAVSTQAKLQQKMMCMLVGGLVSISLIRSIFQLNTLRILSLIRPYTPSHRRRGATVVLVRHKPQWHRHDRRGSEGSGMAETLNMFKTSAVPPRVGPLSAVG